MLHLFVILAKPHARNDRRTEISRCISKVVLSLSLFLHGHSWSFNSFIDSRKNISTLSILEVFIETRSVPLDSPRRSNLLRRHRTTLCECVGELINLAVIQIDFWYFVVTYSRGRRQSCVFRKRDAIRLGTLGCRVHYTSAGRIRASERACVCRIFVACAVNRSLVIIYAL